MKRKMNLFAILFTASFFLFVACQKENIYEDIDNREIQKVDPLIAIDRIMDTPVVMGKVVLDNNDQFQSGWMIDKQAKFHKFQLSEVISFPTRTTSDSELLLETVLKNTTELAQINAVDLMQRARTLEELEYQVPVYRSGEADASTEVYFYFANISNTTCEYNGNPVSFVSTAGCGVGANELTNCTTSNSITTMIIHSVGKSKVTIPYDLGQPLVSYMNSLILEHDESN